MSADEKYLVLLVALFLVALTAGAALTGLPDYWFGATKTERGKIVLGVFAIIVAAAALAGLLDRAGIHIHRRWLLP